MAFDYQSWIGQAKDRLAQLKQQRAAIDTEISKLERILGEVAPLTEEAMAWAGPDASLTESIRQIFKEDARCWSPTAIRDELLNRGVRLGQQNPMATIHQILARLIDKDIRRVDVAGKIKYQTMAHLPSPKGRLTAPDTVKK
jgi:hypothetical protein